MNEKTNIKKQVGRNWLMDAGLFLAGLGATLTGIYFLFLPQGGFQGGRNPYYGITILFDRHDWDALHTWTGVAMIAAVLIHLALHWNWIAGSLTRLAGEILQRRSRMSIRNQINIIVDLIIAMGFFLTAISGLYFLFSPAGVSSRNLPAFLLSAQTWDLVHTWAFVAMTTGIMVHLALHWSWIVSVTKRQLAPSRKARSLPVPVKAQ